ncbi:MAG: hypothetical protein HFI09_02230 [Bacilli bacterium]|nr:hypothetical protein [Bacilli bacterium]
MEKKEIINKFVEQKLEEYPNLLAVLFYGSSCYHTDKKYSDIDLMLIIENGPSMRGKKNIGGLTIDYSIKSLASLEKECMASFRNQETFLLSVFQNGEVIYNKDKTIEKFQRYFRFRYRNNLPTYEINRQEKDGLQKNWQELCKSRNTISFWVIYFNLLNRLRIDYQTMKGYSRLPLSKVAKFYQDPNYAEKYYCSILPEETFRNLFLASIKVLEKEKALKEIQKYAPLFTLEFLEKTNVSSDFNMRKENFYQTPNQNALKETSTKLISKYQQVMFALMENLEDANYLYYVVLEQLRRFYEIQCGVLNTSPEKAIANYQGSLNNNGLLILDPDFMSSYLKALTAKDSKEKMTCLEKIYFYALKDIPINDTEYLIKLQK